MAAKKYGESKSVFGRLLRAIISITVLTVFVLGITFSVKELSSLNSKSMLSFVYPYLSKIGLEEDKLGQVAGIIFNRDTSGTITKSTEGETIPEDIPTLESEVESPEESKVVYMLAIFSDIHIANDKQEYIDNKENFRKALKKTSDLGVSDMVILGDLTNWGVLEDLRESKSILDEFSLQYYVIPGDRDLAQSIGTDNFMNVFKVKKHTFEHEGKKFLVFDNSANFTLISDEDIKWFSDEIKDTDFVFLSQPLYTEGLVMFNYLYMGSTQDTQEGSLLEKQNAVKEQRNKLLDLVRSSDAVAVIAGDHHKSSMTVDKIENGLTHYVVGAISGTVSEYAQSVLQSQRFSLLKIYDNGTYSIEDILL